MLTLLFVKHWLADFVLQYPYMLSQKGSYGAMGGIHHSLVHAVGTFLAFVLLNAEMALFLAVVDGIIHYHIDWIKINYGAKDPAHPQFWAAFGLDQLAHSLTYLLLVALWTFWFIKSS